MVTPLSQRIIAHIRETGKPMTFAQFMEMALYDPDHGYYMTGGNRSRMDSPALPIGKEGGDFYTAPCVSPLLAKCFVRQLQEIDDLLGHPSEFTLLEMGPGDGRFMNDVLEEIARADQALRSRLSIILVEKSSYLRSVQESRLAGHADTAKITWVSDLRLLHDELLVGVMVSNELVDAFPVHRVHMEREGLKEIYVNHVDGQFIEQLGEPSTEALLKTLEALDVELPVGFTTEINLHAIDWMKQVARVLRRGVVVTIDYGHTSQDYVSPMRKNGTLLCYYRHTVTANPYERIGEQDMTAHVNFSSLAQVGEQAGLSLAGFTNLMHFLMSLGIDEFVEGYDQGSEDVQAAIQLLRPRGMGDTFKVLIQHRGLEVPTTLRALQHRPFFEHVLASEGCVT